MIRFNSIWNKKIKDNMILKLISQFTTTNSIKLKSFAEIPGPKSFPLVGNLFAYKEFG